MDRKGDKSVSELFVTTCGREACAPGHRYGPAVRKYHLIHVVASGHGIFDDGRKRWPVRTGQGFAIFPDDVTVYAADDTLPWDYTWVGFAGDGAAELVERAGSARERPVFDLGNYAATALQICHGLCEDMTLLDLNLQAARGGLLRLMAYIAQSRADASPQRSGDSGVECWRRARWAMRANFERADYHIEDVAAYVGLSRSQLFRICKRHGGRSPREMLSDLRLSRAKQLLSGTDLTLTEVALSSGYASAARLGEVFRDAMDMTPTQYRRESLRPIGEPPSIPGPQADGIKNEDPIS